MDGCALANKQVNHNKINKLFRSQVCCLLLVSFVERASISQYATEFVWGMDPDVLEVVAVTLSSTIRNPFSSDAHNQQLKFLIPLCDYIPLYLSSWFQDSSESVGHHWSWVIIECSRCERKTHTSKAQWRITKQHSITIKVFSFGSTTSNGVRTLKNLSMCNVYNVVSLLLWVGSPRLCPRPDKEKMVHIFIPLCMASSHSKCKRSNSYVASNMQAVYAAKSIRDVSFRVISMVVSEQKQTCDVSNGQRKWICILIETLQKLRKQRFQSLCFVAVVQYIIESSAQIDRRPVKVLSSIGT